MCTSCGCRRPDDDHGDSRNITLTILRCAAEAAGISTQQAAANIAATFPVEIAGEAVDVQSLEPDPVMKALASSDYPKKFVLGVAYPANRVDGHHEWASKESLELAAWSYVRKGREVGFFHADTLGHGEIVESYIYRGPDWVIDDISGNQQVVKSGDWMLGAILDEPAFELVLKKKADGWSLDGGARRRKRSVPDKP